MSGMPLFPLLASLALAACVPREPPVHLGKFTAPEGEDEKMFHNYVRCQSKAEQVAFGTAARVTIEYAEAYDTTVVTCMTAKGYAFN